MRNLDTTPCFYVYEHIRNDTKEVFYVGKGKGNRSSNKSIHHRSKYWQRIVSKANGFSIRYVAVDIEEELAFFVEIERISQLKENGVSLCNLTDGGEGTSGLVFTEEHKNKIGDAHRGKTMSEEARAKISASLKVSGFKHTPEMLEKMSKTHIGKKRSLGYKHTEEWKAEQSKRSKGNKSRTGQKRSEEEKMKQSLVMSGRIQKKVKCPHCNKEGGNTMGRWHFDNCKYKRISS